MHNPKNIWGRLAILCRGMHELIYVEGDEVRALRELPKLERMLIQLSESDLAIIKAEALALLHTLKGDVALAIMHRQRGVELTERLHQSIRDNNQDEETKRFMLQYRDEDALRKRKEIIAELRQKLAKS